MKKKIIGILVCTLLIICTYCNASNIKKLNTNERKLFFNDDLNFTRFLSFNDPNEEWNKTYGKNGYCCSVDEINDEGYIITGVQGRDIFLTKLDENGNELWTKKFGGDRQDLGFCVQHTSDNGFVIIGVTNSFDVGDGDVWLIKTDEYGNMMWNRTFGGEKLDEGHSGQETIDGGYVILGVTKSYVEERNDYWLIKTDEDGIEMWNTTIGGIGWDVGISVQQTNDEGYILTGIRDVSSDGSHQVDVGLEKIDANGNIEWEKTFGSIYKRQDEGISVRQTNDGGYIVTGVIDADQDSIEGGDLWLIKTDSEGNKQWEKTFGGSGSDVGMSVWQTNDDGYIVLGMTDSFGAGGYDILLLRIDSNGYELWDMTYGGNKDDIIFFGPNSVQQTKDGGYIAVGATESYKNTPSIGPVPWVIRISAFENQRPDKPTITGHTSGNAREKYTYYFSTIDKDNDQIYYLVDWGDNSNSGPLGPYSSSETIEASHIWNIKGNYEVKVQAKDEHGGESDWETLSVSMPKNKPINTPFLNFLEHHPHMFPLLRQIFGLQ